MSSNIVKLNPEDNVIRRQIQAVEFGYVIASCRSDVVLVRARRAFLSLFITVSLQLMYLL